MKSVRLLIALSAFSLAVGCADENDPKTWVKRLEDPAQRAPAVKRLGQFFEDAMTKNSKKRDAPEVTQLLDVIVQPMTEQYTKGGLDEKTRKELIKELSDMRDPRTAPALTKAFLEYEPQKSEEDVRYAAQATKGLQEMGKLTDQALIDALWTCFTKFSPTKSKSLNTTTDLHDAVVAVHHTSYGPKAAERISPAHKVVLNDEPVNDELDFWQLTCIQVISELKYDDDKAIHNLVGVMMTKNKLKIMNPAKTALLKMTKKSVPVLVSALNGSDPEFAAMQADWGPDKGYVIPLIDVLSYSSTNAAKDAILAALPSADNDTNRAAYAQTLVLFPTESKLIDAFKTTFAKLPPIADKGGDDTGRERTNLLQLAGEFFEPSLLPWVLGEAKSAKGDFVIAAQVNALQSAFKLMQPDQKKQVEDAVKALEATKVSAQEKQAVTSIRSAFDAASSALDKCQKDTSCYLGILEETVPTNPPTANWKGIKAAAMCAILGDETTITGLVGKLGKAINPGVRLAVSSAIDHLAPKGNPSVADQLDKIVAGDKATSNKELLAADDALVKVALRLRARAGQ
jgi:hypothetical protein